MVATASCCLVLISLTVEQIAVISTSPDAPFCISREYGSQNIIRERTAYPYYCCFECWHSSHSAGRDQNFVFFARLQHMHVVDSMTAWCPSENQFGFICHFSSSPCVVYKCFMHGLQSDAQHLLTWLTVSIVTVSLHNHLLLLPAAAESGRHENKLFKRRRVTGLDQAAGAWKNHRNRHVKIYNNRGLLSVTVMSWTENGFTSVNGFKDIE